MRGIERVWLSEDQDDILSPTSLLMSALDNRKRDSSSPYSSALFMKHALSSSSWKPKLRETLTPCHLLWTQKYVSMITVFEAQTRRSMYEDPYQDFATSSVVESRLRSSYI